MRILDGAPEGWDIYEYPGRAQPFTISHERALPHHYSKHVGGLWRNRETISFHATEKEAWAKLKVMAG